VKAETERNKRVRDQLQKDTQESQETILQLELLVK
jgi:hypothetical protein